VMNNCARDLTLSLMTLPPNPVKINLSHVDLSQIQKILILISITYFHVIDHVIMFIIFILNIYCDLSQKNAKIYLSG